MQASLVKKKVDKPFVFADLKEFQPHWCQNLAGEATKYLKFAQWNPAFDRYALAASADVQWKFTSALAHKDVVLQVSK